MPLTVTTLLHAIQSERVPLSSCHYNKDRSLLSQSLSTIFCQVDMLLDFYLVEPIRPHVWFLGRRQSTCGLPHRK